MGNKPCADLRSPAPHSWPVGVLKRIPKNPNSIENVWDELQRQLDGMNLESGKVVMQDAAFITSDPGHARSDKPRGMQSRACPRNHYSQGQCEDNSYCYRFQPVSFENRQEQSQNLAVAIEKSRKMGEEREKNQKNGVYGRGIGRIQDGILSTLFHMTLQRKYKYEE
jgi:hypothetical protein